MKTGAWVRIVVVVSLLLTSGLAMRSAAAVQDLKVTTDTSIDCSSIATIARDLYRDCKTDEEKAIATWYFVRRVMFHWPHIPTWDTVELINSYGIGLCGYQSKAFAEIAQAGGLKARTLHMPGHVLAEVWYDGDWHFFDCQVGWFAFEEVDGKRTVASAEDIAKDPSIVLNAVAEGRASEPFFQCRVNARSSDSPEDGVRYAKNARPRGSPKPLDTRLVIDLRPGESITRNWSNEGKSWFDREGTKDKPSFTSLRHPCTASPIDENDPVNWPYWQPYATRVRNKEGKMRYGEKRYYGNGRMVYAPDLASEAFREGLAPGGLVNVATGDEAGPALRPADADMPGEVIFAIDCPYVAVDAWLDFKGVCKGKGDSVAVYARPADAKDDAWMPVWQSIATGAFQAEEISLKEIAWEQHKYFVKVRMQSAGGPAGVGIDDIRFTTVFVNNMYALPYFMPGKNTIRLSAEKAEDLKDHPVTLTYVWEQQGGERRLEKKIEKLPAEFTVTVPGEQMPKMKSVTLAVE